MGLNLAQRTGSIIRSTRAMKDRQAAESHKSPLCLFGVAGFRQFFCRMPSRQKNASKVQPGHHSQARRQTSQIKAYNFPSCPLRGWKAHPEDFLTGKLFFLTRKKFFLIEKKSFLIEKNFFLTRKSSFLGRKFELPLSLRLPPIVTRILPCFSPKLWRVTDF